MKNYIKIAFTMLLSFMVAGVSAQYTIKTKDLEIKMVADYDWIYNDSGTGADRNLSIWRPKTTSGFYRLGYYAHGSHGKPQAVSLLVKGRTNGALSHPKDYQWIYNDSGTGGDHDVTVWMPIAPPGYKALGMIASNGAKPALTEVVCVREDLVIGTSVGKFIWNDGGSGGDHDGSVWYINPPSIQDEKKAYMTSGSFIFNRAHGKPSVSDVAYGLEVKMLTEEMTSKPQKPRLTSTNEPPKVTSPVLISTSKLPCISVNDPSYVGRVQQQINETPIYTLERYAYYKRHGFSHNTDTEDGTMEAEFEVGMEHSREKSMEKTFETSTTLEAGVESGIYSASVSVTMSYAVSHSESVSTTRSKSKSFGNEYRVPAQGAAALYTLSYKFVLKNGRGRQVNAWEMDSDNSTYFVTYDPKRNNNNTTTTNNNNTNTTVTTNINTPVTTTTVKSSVGVATWNTGKNWGGGDYLPMMGDLDGDGQADRLVYNKNTGNWGGWLNNGRKSSFDGATWGSQYYVALVGDLNGDGKDDRAVFDARNGDWGGQITDGGKTSFDATQWGAGDYKPLLGDLNGDGTDDRVVYGNNTGYWGASLSNGSAGSFDADYFGGSGFIPLLGDLNGDGKDDRVLFNATKGTWQAKLTDGGVHTFPGNNWGMGEYQALLADVNGDGKDDRVLYGTSSGYWAVWITGGGAGSFDADIFGSGSHLPMLKDVNGDKKADRIIYNKASGEWQYKLTK